MKRINRFDNVPIWAPVAAVAMAFAWLLPNSSPPWIAFHKDFWVALVLLIVAASVVAKMVVRRQTFSVDAIAGLLLGLSALSLGQWLTGKVFFFGHAAVGFGYFFAAGCMVSISRAWERLQQDAVGDFLFAAVVIGATGSAGLVLKQWLGIDGLEVWTQLLATGSRPYGNLLQPNNAATLLLLGVVGYFWAYRRVAIGRTGLLLGTLTLTFALVLTQSRIGYLSFLALGMIALWGARSNHAFKSWRAPVLMLLLSFVIAVMVLPHLTGWLGLSQEFTLLERTQGEVRLLVYRTFAKASLLEPWAGYGFAQGIEAQLATAAAGYELPGLFTWTHNALLDIAIWFGLPVALIATGILAKVGLTAFRSRLDPEAYICLAGLFVLAMHAMVELPLAYAYFLLPAVMLMGILAAKASLPSISVRPWGAVVGVAVLALLLGTVGTDYLKVEKSFSTWRFKLARVGKDHPMDIPDTLLLHQYRALIVGVRTPAPMLNAKEREEFSKAVLLDPSPAAMQAIVVSYVEAGDVASAQQWADRARWLSSPEYRKALAASWRYRAEKEPRFAVVNWRD